MRQQPYCSLRDTKPYICPMDIVSALLSAHVKFAEIHRFFQREDQSIRAPVFRETAKTPSSPNNHPCDERPPAHHNETMFLTAQHRPDAIRIKSFYPWDE